jgi:hypothetical protein
MKAYTYTNRMGAQLLAVLAIFSLLMSMLPTQAFAQEVPPGEQTEETISTEETMSLRSQTPQEPQIKICHATDKKYDNGKKEVDQSSILGGEGHDGHDDGGYNDTGDIIPPFGDYEGKNWEEPYISIYNNDCKIEAKIVVDKIVVGNDDVDDKDFTFKVGDTNVDEKKAKAFEAGQYVVTETPKQGTPTNFTATFSGDCNAQGQITAVLAHTKTCTITNDYTDLCTNLPGQQFKIPEGYAQDGDYCYEVEDPCEEGYHFNNEEECEPNDPELVEITACKYERPYEDADSVAKEGWGMRLTNGTEEGTFELVTGSNGCVSKMVDPEEGPWRVIEEVKSNWVQEAVDATEGVEIEVEENIACEFFGRESMFDKVFTFFTDNNEDDEANVVLEFRCDFTNSHEEVSQCKDEPEGSWADGVVSSAQGNTKGNGAITDPNRTNPAVALGASDWTPNTNDSTGFFSLGFGGSIVLSFDSYVPNVVGADLTVHEATNGDSYPAETATIEVSQDGVGWVSAGVVNNATIPSRTTAIDFDATGLSWIKFVRITDTTANGPHDAAADGFDLDAVEATQQVCDEPEDPNKETETIKVCKYEAGEVSTPVAGWDVTISNNSEEEDEVTISTTTAANGCVEVEVYEEDGPFYVTEEMQEGWEQYNVTASNGIVFGEEGAESCSFFDYAVDRLYQKYSVSDEDEYRCNFYNQQLEVPQCTNLLTNGSFEDPVVGADWNIFSAVTGWIIDTIGSDSDGLELWANGFYGGASNGNQNAELDGNAPTTISQLVTTVPGATYSLSFDFSARPDADSAADNSIDAVVGTTTVFNATASGADIATNTWTTHSNTFVATGTATKVSFVDKGTANSLGSLMDNAKVCFVRNGDGGGGNNDGGGGSSTTGGGGGGGGSRISLTDNDNDGDVEGASTSNLPKGKVLGDASSIMPIGAPNTGAGGMAPVVITLPTVLAILSSRTEVQKSK